MRLIGILLIAWILSWFGFDHLIQIGMKEIFGISIGTGSYYFLAVCLWALILIFGG